MIKGIGVDICDLRRLNHLDQLAKKILHVDEFSLYLSKGNDKAKREFGIGTANDRQCSGGRLAVKEAFVKAAGYKSFKEICCLNDKNGKPYIKDEPCHVSISHENHYAVAFVVIENNDPNQ